MARVDKLAIARKAIESLPSRLRATGKYSPATARQPALRSLEVGRWSVCFGEHVLLCPEDPALSSLLDVWEDGTGKVFSVSWMPDRPWLPPRIVRCKPGAWQDLLRPTGEPAAGSEND